MHRFLNVYELFSQYQRLKVAMGRCDTYAKGPVTYGQTKEFLVL